MNSRQVANELSVTEGRFLSLPTFLIHNATLKCMSSMFLKELFLLIIKWREAICEITDICRWLLKCQTCRCKLDVLVWVVNTFRKLQVNKRMNE